MNIRNVWKSKVMAWVLVIAMLLSMMPSMASKVEAAVPHPHNGTTFTPGVGQGVLRSGSYYLVHDEKVVQPSSGIVISGSAVTVNICLNGHTLDLNGTQIYLNAGATLNIYDCSDGGGKITGGEGKVHGDSNTKTKGGAIYVEGSTLNIYGGTIEGNSAGWGGAIFIDGSLGVSTVNMYDGTICGNTAESGGGGIEVENGTGPTYGSYFHMYGGSIVNNTVTNPDSNLHKGGGVHVVSNTIMTIQSMNNKAINISGNTVAGKMDNVYLREGSTIGVGEIAEGSRIGVSAQQVNSTTPTLITSGYGSNISNDSIKYFYMDGLHSSSTYALIHNGTELQIQSQKHTWKYAKGDGDNQIRAYWGQTMNVRSKMVPMH